jgi:hypothetical protein
MRQESRVRSHRGSNYSIGSKRESNSPTRKNSVRQTSPSVNLNISGGFRPKMPKALGISQGEPSKSSRNTLKAPSNT